jgi:P pilus assembly chaperone PapD
VTRDDTDKNNNVKNNKVMKKILFAFVALMGFAMSAAAEPKVTFESTSHNFGTFSEANATQKCVFTFTNTGDQPLVINQAVASCGCTVPKYTKTPIKPGEKGTINVTYNGQGKFPGHFKKTITVRTNGTPEMVRLYIEGDMTEK